DAIDLMLFEHPSNGRVERTGGRQILAKRFLDDDFRVVGVAEVASGQTTRTQVLDDDAKHGRWRGNIKECLNVAPEIFFQVSNMGGQPIERRFVVVPAGDVAGL